MERLTRKNVMSTYKKVVQKELDLPSQRKIEEEEKEKKEAKKQEIVNKILALFEEIK